MAFVIPLRAAMARLGQGSALALVFLVLFCSATVVFPQCNTQGVDRTLEDGATGGDVVKRRRQTRSGNPGYSATTTSFSDEWPKWNRTTEERWVWGEYGGSTQKLSKMWINSYCHNKRPLPCNLNSKNNFAFLGLQTLHPGNTVRWMFHCTPH